MNQLTKKDPSFDVIVVGAGLPGLIISSALKQKGMEVCLLEDSEFPGSHSRSVYSPLGLVDNGLKFFPATKAAESALGRLNYFLSHPLEFGAVENGPITFQNGAFKPFIGFGNEAPEFHRELSYFLASQRLELSYPLGKLISDLVQSVGDSFSPGATVTKYLGADSRIHSVQINGQKTISAGSFVHAASPKLLATLLCDGLISARGKQKISKATYWTILGVDFFHQGTVSERPELHLLNGTTHDDLGPCFGLFHPPAFSIKENLPSQHSQWMTFMEQDSSEDPEWIATILKKIKRQIKRAYPEALENLYSERILVAPLAATNLDLKIDSRGTFPGVENLWLGHGTFSQGLNLIGAIEQALSTIERLAGTQATPFELHQLHESDV